jgi:hypothetical protein
VLLQGEAAVAMPLLLHELPGVQALLLNHVGLLLVFLQVLMQLLLEVV